VSAFQSDRFNLGSLTLDRTLGNTMVDIYVGAGAQKKQFHIHKALLCAKIPYFDKMFNSGFKEGKENSAELPEDKPESFDILQEWVYTGTLPKFQITREQGKGNPTNFSFQGLYTLADKLCLDSLRDQIVTDVIDMANSKIQRSLGRSSESLLGLLGSCPQVTPWTRCRGSAKNVTMYVP